MHAGRKAKIIIAGLLFLAAVIIFTRTTVLSLFYFPENSGPVPTPSTSSPNSPNISSADPARLTIPSLGVNAGVQYVGVNAQGNMRAPSNFTDVAWYEYGPAPGESGNAVIDGHVDNGLGLPGVFKNLDSIKVGDDIYITTKSGSKRHFVVSDIELYPYTNAPAETIFNQANLSGPMLNLITCDGVWVPGGDTYDHRLVVYSKLAS